MSNSSWSIPAPSGSGETLNGYVEEWIAEVLMCLPGSLPPERTPLSEIDGWDSLRHVSLILGLERELNAKLTGEQIKAIVTIGDVAGLLRRKVVDG